MNILVSACLLGVPCRYDGTPAADPQVLSLADGHALVPVCPEQLGGLPTPRPPAEIRDGRVVTKAGADVTDAYRRGAEATAALAQTLGCRCAVLKARSPSCGSGHIYDGSFSRRLVDGDGLAAAVLKREGIRVLNEEETAAREAMA